MDPQTGESFQIHACTHCGLGWTWPRPESLDRYYGAAYHGNRHGFTARFCRWRRMRLLKGQASEPGRLLDVGCGDGSFLVEARALGWEVCGLERGSVAEQVRAQGLDVRSGVAELRGEAPFQAVTLWHSLEHMEDPPGLLRALREQLAPGGCLLIAVPDAAGFQARLFGPHWLHLDCPRHLWHFDRGSMEALLGKAGLEITWVGHQELEFDAFGWIQSLLNAGTGEPNGLFHALTGKPHGLSRGEVALQAGFAALATLPALAATTLGTWAGRGGTLVVAARKASSGEAREP